MFCYREKNQQQHKASGPFVHLDLFMSRFASFLSYPIHHHQEAQVDNNIVLFISATRDCACLFTAAEEDPFRAVGTLHATR